MTSLSDLSTSAYTRLVDIAFDEQATASELFLVVLAFAAAWFVLFYVAKSIIRPLVHDQPWLREALERDYERSNTKKMLADLSIDMTKDECIDWSIGDWPRLQCIYVQHFVGSVWCLPALLGIGDPSITSSLAIFGILSEMGWEVQDLLEILFIRLFFKNGKTIWPDAIVAIFVVHHSLTGILGVPMVLHYRNNPSLHWLTFNLQFAAAVALSIGEYTKLLDISQPSSLKRFKILNGVAFVTMAWTRVVHYTYLCFDLYRTWYEEGAYRFLYVGVPLSLLFFLFSLECCVKPFYRKFVKFLHVSAEYDSLPADATPESRRASVAKLDQAVAELLEGDGLVELTELVEPIFVKRRTSRRKTMPVQSRKRRSLVMLRSHSMFDESFEKSKSKEL